MTKRELLARIELLEARIVELERRGTITVAPAPVPVPYYPWPTYPQWPAPMIWCETTSTSDEKFLIVS